MQRRVQSVWGSAQEWYRDNVLANVPQTDSEKIEFVHASDYGDEQGGYYDEQGGQFVGGNQGYGATQDGEPNGFTNANGSYTAAKFGEYEEFGDPHGGGDPHQRISEWQAGWNVTNAIQV